MTDMVNSYLNMHGCEQEGLYRVPGNSRDIKLFQMKFDTRKMSSLSLLDHLLTYQTVGDVDLLSITEPFDINIVGSLFKDWLRKLPDELLPKDTQKKIQAACQGAKETPQMLKDELSKLPPFNYYLLFAITCHISLLHSCSKLNLMDYRNLCICFQPCMKVDAFCFQFLVLDWRNCWQGCWTEKEYLAEEQEWLQQHEKLYEHAQVPAQRTQKLNGVGSKKTSKEEDRQISSAGSSKPSITSSTTSDANRMLPFHMEDSPPTEHDQDDEEENSTTTPTQARPRPGFGAPNISPIKPLSPLGPM